jgi:hypothetical protein
MCPTKKEISPIVMQCSNNNEKSPIRQKISPIIIDLANNEFLTDA